MERTWKHEEIINKWDGIAEYYHNNVAFNHRHLVIDMINVIKAEENQYILDLGCGSGESTFEVILRLINLDTNYALLDNYNIVGVDISEKMIDLAVLLFLKSERLKNVTYNIKVFHNGKYSGQAFYNESKIKFIYLYF
jgi:ubiquinone/menaquinone biosynthesis C-methylase UbiE